MDSLRRLLDATARCFSRYENVLAERPVLAAISGGVDSSVLALVLARLATEDRLPGPLHFCHVDHGVRPDSAANARHVVDLADRLDVPIHVRRLADEGAAAAESRSPRGATPGESELRERRYAAIAAVARQLGAAAVTTAHHADDNMETVLFRMLRGTGPRGLAGIPEARWHCTEGHRLLVVRPFLRTRRSTLASMLSGLGIAAFEDSTNADLRFARNRLRHETMPQLRERLGIGLDVALLTLCSTARAATEILEAQGVRILCERSRRRGAAGIELDLRDLAAGAEPFVEEALRLAHTTLHPDGVAPLRRWTERAMALLQRPDGSRLAGRGGLLLERTRHGLLLVDPARAGAPPRNRPGEPGQLFLLDAGRQRFGATEWWLEANEHPLPPLVPTPLEAGRCRALLDPRAAPLPWRLRARRTGDRFWPLGHTGDVELRRFLQNRHVPRWDRDRLPLVCDALDRILWIPGVEVAENAKVRLNTRRTIELRAGC